MLKLVARLTLGVNDLNNFAGSIPAIHKHKSITILNLINSLLTKNLC